MARNADVSRPAKGFRQPTAVGTTWQIIDFDVVLPKPCTRFTNHIGSKYAAWRMSNRLDGRCRRSTPGVSSCQQGDLYVSATRPANLRQQRYGSNLSTAPSV